jgi:hypothetical protein
MHAITPPHMQKTLEEVLHMGIFDMKTAGATGRNGAGIAGIQGMGVSTPKAAAVAAMTAGFMREVHIPKEDIFKNGI